jgi:hypothetical protein
MSASDQTARAGPKGSMNMAVFSYEYLRVSGGVMIARLFLTVSQCSKV